MLRRWRSAVEGASQDAERVAVVNDALAELEHEIDASAGAPAAAMRLAAYGGIMAAAAGLVWGRVPELGLGVPVALAVAMGVGLARRRGEAEARRCRREADRGVFALVGSLVDRDVAMPARRRRGTRRHRRGPRERRR
ncbi:MAG: hypothetical protein AAGN82_20020 [Myxococcota bacterium]